MGIKSNGKSKLPQEIDLQCSLQNTSQGIRTLQGRCSRRQEIKDERGLDKVKMARERCLQIKSYSGKSYNTEQPKFFDYKFKMVVKNGIVIIYSFTPIHTLLRPEGHFSQSYKKYKLSQKIRKLKLQQIQKSCSSNGQLLPQELLLLELLEVSRARMCMCYSANGLKCLYPKLLYCSCSVHI